MKAYKYFHKDPYKAYVSNNLLLPKEFIQESVVKAALSFTLNIEEPVVDEDTGEAIGTRQKVLNMWDENLTHLVVPREFITRRQRETFGCEFVDLPPPEFEAVKIGNHIELRDEGQAAAFNALLSHDSGTLNLSCGRGKTVIALKAAATLKVPTIIVVNTTALLEQWREEIERHLDVDSVGILQGNRHDWEGHPIVLSMIHTLSQRRGHWSMDFRRRFGLVVYDEAHHVSAPLFVKSADLFFGKRYSLTATAQRTDGLEIIYQYHLGRVIHQNLTQDLIPTTIFHALQWSLPFNHKPQVVDKNGDVNTSRVRTYLGRLEWRNHLIYQHLLWDLEEGRQVLVLSHIVKHVRVLHDMLAARGAGMIIGDTPQDSRMSILKNCNPIFGTFQLAREGLNKPSLDTLYIVTPFSNSNDLQQSLGRIQRQYSNKLPPVARVFEDLAFDCCVKSCNNLRNILRGFTYPIERVTVTEEECLTTEIGIE
jgi:superfamily II DNA or RNA helicase